MEQFQLEIEALLQFVLEEYLRLYSLFRFEFFRAVGDHILIPQYHPYPHEIYLVQVGLCSFHRILFENQLALLYKDEANSFVYKGYAE